MGLKDTISNCRKSKKCRMSIIGVLMLLVLMLIFFWGKAKTALIVILVFLAIAMGLEGFDYDADLQKLWKTGNYQESRVETVKDKSGNTIKLVGECVKADVNCDNFQTQGDAQAMYNKCAAEIAQNNPGLDDPKKLDIYGLDRDKDGLVCEHLRKTAPIN